MYQKHEDVNIYYNQLQWQSQGIRSTFSALKSYMNFSELWYLGPIPKFHTKVIVYHHFIVSVHQSVMKKQHYFKWI
jgi:hypothetical protein